ncbi:hypothetical protein GO730_16190 [Spirosoma sp. HMF3257]|uniref:FtsX-like permease family protein n=1 Tax=Spirosoma telluris TaxID=2183553 RepID=A0A327NLT2_9BACT|nr:hypothetical protein [Spirosoma telluris]RAI75329.1 hypothetical protein HMF3257_16135 [Spirosoma telluris]
MGVLKDFHNQSLLDPIEGTLFSVDQPRLSLFSIKIQAQDKAETLKFIQQEWDKYFPEKGFSYQFLDERLAQLYEREQRLSKLIGYFAGLAILLSCLGLYGLVSLVTQQKTKEIGIRKVLGHPFRVLLACCPETSLFWYWWRWSLPRPLPGGR